MASCEQGGQKKKRAWRKPREAIGPGVLETSSETKPKLARISQEPGEKSTSAPDQRRGTSAATSEQQISPSPAGAREKGSGSHDRGETQGKLEQEQKGGGEPSSVSSLTTAAPLEIDGSVLEGVGNICPY